MQSSSRPAATWHLVTCEFPPAVGGVADFTRVVAHGLSAAGAGVHVWAPPPAADTPGAVVHEVAGAYRVGSFRALDQALDASPGPRRLFVQWVPHGYGYKSLNLPFCLWVRRRARRGDSLDLMVHEPFLPFDRTRLRQNAGALAHRIMLTILLSAADRVWVSTAAFLPRIHRFTPGQRPSAWLPVPSPVAPAGDVAGASALRTDLAAGRPLVGYFGAANPLVEGTLIGALEAIAATCPDARFALGGVGTDAFRRRVVESGGPLATSIVAAGPGSPAAISRLLDCCDVFVQPYPDGASTRRTTLMALLAHGRPVVTNSGPSTEPLWKDSGAVELVPSGDGPALGRAVARLLSDAPARSRLGERARALYDSRFDVSRTVAALLGDPS